MLNTRIVQYARLGARHGVMPRPLELSVTIEHNNLAVVSLHYDRFESPEAIHLEEDPELAIEYLTQAGVWTEIENSRVRLQMIDYDHYEETPTRRYDFIGIGECLQGILVWNDYGRPVDAETGRIKFVATNVGDVMKTIWANAVSRGWTGYTMHNYANASTQDALGYAWPTTFDIDLAIEANALSVLNRLVAMGLVDYRWVGRELWLYKPGIINQNLSSGPNPIYYRASIAGIDSAPESVDTSTRATTLLTLGKGGNLTGNKWEYTVSGPILPEGRREIAINYEGVETEASADVFVAPILLRAANYLTNTTRQFHLSDEVTMLPFFDYNVGQYIDVQRTIFPTAGVTWEWVNLRILTINIQVNANGTQGYVVFGDKIDDLLTTMYQRIQRLTQGIEPR